MKLSKILKYIIWVEGTVTQIEKTLMNDHIRASEVFWKFRIPTIYNFAVIDP